jgi:hypothetical protein
MISLDIGVWIASILTIGVFSFVYKDTKIFRFCEHTFVAVAMGYSAVLVIKSLVGVAIIPIQQGALHLIIPILLGLAIFTQLSRRQAWVSRYPVAVYVGTSLGVGLRSQIAANVVPQIIATIGFPFGTPWDTFNSVVALLSIVGTIFYFYFTKNVFKNPATRNLNLIGRYAIMIALGAAFGFTILGRFTLMLGRLQALVYDWLGFPGG